ncbi:hypothetical protein COCON_G00197130 [Conger conger]|uniref:TSC22 domain family protein 1 n=1 Tax=Conger conger TaxID=82655 RepID=A0A9Q1D1P4_CONCO|nr:hypothetical protein COCON_G00197130 [Conger conger]
MHHPEPAGDPSGTRKMAHPAIFTRRGSGTGGVSALTTVGSTSISNNLVPTDDYQSPVVMQPPPPAGSSSPGPQHPPHSLNLLAQSQMQPQAIPSTGAQIKKKSGFQITSVTPAQISVSTNNSIAEDTESYDDLDESHTEDLSSSEILDVSLSRATDMGGPERSSSEETLSNLHDAETPGAVSPNQPPHPLGQPQPQPPPPQGAMVNGTVHHHHHHHRLHHHLGHHQLPTPPSGAGPPPPVPSPGGPVGGTSVPASVPCPSGALPSVAQTLPVSVGAILENACGAVPVTQTPVAVGSLSTAAAAQIGVAGLGAGNTSMLSPCLGSSSSSGGGVSPGPVNPTGASMPGIGGQTAALIPQQPSGNTSVGIAMTGATLGGQAGAMGAAHHPSSMAPVPATLGPPGPTQTQTQAPTAASSRFRVVKLDSSSEPFRKGRWTCTEYYDKESTPPPVPPAVPLAVPPVVPAAVHPAENPRQAVPETVACTEVESTSGSSVSTLSHYSESVGSGEMGGPSAALDYAQAPPQDVMTPLPKTTVAPSR